MLNKIINTLGTKVISAIFNLSIAIIISQHLGDTGKGKQALLLMTITFILIFSDIISGRCIVYLTPKYPFSKIIFPSYLWSFLVGIVASIIIYLFGFGVDNTLIIHLGILTIFASFNAINTSILIGKEKVHTANYISLLQPVFIFATLCIFYIFMGNKSIYPYIFSLYIAYGCCWLLGIAALRKEYLNIVFFKLKEYKLIVADLFKYGFLNQCGHIIQFINLRLGYYLLDIYANTGKVGVFSNAVSLGEAVWIISSSIALVQYARIANTNDGKYAQLLTLQLAKICFLFSLVLVLFLICLPSAFFTFVFGTEFIELSSVIRLLAPGVLCYSVFLILGHFFSGIGKYQINMYASIAGLLFTILLGFILIPKIYFYGAAITSSVSYIATTVFILIVFLKHTHLSISNLLLTKTEIKDFYNHFQRYSYNILSKLRTK
jgi:O-antigen/teichoic acid export membrane protein